LRGNGCAGTTYTTKISGRSIALRSIGKSYRTEFVNNGGCDFPVNPLIAPPEAPVFWLPQQDTSIIVLGTTPPELPPVDPPPRIQAETSVTENSTTCLLFNLENGQHLQIVHGVGVPAAAIIPLCPDGLDRLEAVHRLLAALHGRAIPPDTRLTSQQRARFYRMLQAFDGYRAGATRREIAQIVFKVGVLDRNEWQTSSARHAVKALIRDARTMIAGGYLKLLRHRRTL
jgi:hypothetical protein